MSNGTSRWGRLLFFALSMFVPLSLLLFACSSDVDGTSGSSVPLPPDYVPVEASAQNPLPPGAGPKDAGIVPPGMDAARDTSRMDATVPDSSPADSGSSDATGQ
jgi:hypothetical protein